LNLNPKFFSAISLDIGILEKMDVWCFVYSFIFLLAHQSFDLVGSLTLLQIFIKLSYDIIVIQWFSGSLVWIYDIIVWQVIFFFWTYGCWFFKVSKKWSCIAMVFEFLIYHFGLLFPYITIDTKYVCVCVFYPKTL
jgi:hypothetical protein